MDNFKDELEELEIDTSEDNENTDIFDQNDYDDDPTELDFDHYNYYK